MNKYYKKGLIFPYEVFFENQGFLVINNRQVDLIAERQDEKWIVEAGPSVLARRYSVH